MPKRERTLLIVVWLAVTVVVAGAALLAYRRATTVTARAGRVDPSRIYEDPALVIEEPGLLGTAVELRVTEVVDACMETAGFDYRGPAPVGDLDDLTGANGYGIAAGPIPDVALGAGGDDGDAPGYATALYGAALDGDAGGGGCAAAGLGRLRAAVATLRSFPYPIEQLEADLAADPSYRRALEEWSACMARRDVDAATPEELVASFAERLRRARGEAGRILAEEERRAAEADLRCRQTTLAPAVASLADRYGAAFVDRNRTQLERLIPPPGAADLPPGLGTGDVQVTLQWDSEVDLDLAVVDPAGSRIAYDSRTAPSGGTLDRDANFPCSASEANPVENVFWPPDGAPPGTYRAIVTYRRTCTVAGPVSFRLTVRLDGRTAERAEGTLDPGESADYSFAYPP
jgi:hypothetical protein